MSETVAVSVNQVNKFLRKMLDDRLAELRTLQLAAEPSSTAHTVLTIRIDECTVLINRWGLNDV